MNKQRNGWKRRKKREMGNEEKENGRKQNGMTRRERVL